MMKPKLWDGNDLKGEWLVTAKIDGVRALWDKDVKIWRSRAGNELYNIPTQPLANSRGVVSHDYEIFLGNFKDTISAIKTKNPTSATPVILPEHMYALAPVDPRLYITRLLDPPSYIISQMLDSAVNAMGYEGLVLHSTGAGPWIKVKKEETHDVTITGFIEGKGKYVGTLGAIETNLGRVGTGFDDDERHFIWQTRTNLIRTIVEVSCMQMTDKGRFRHARFVRLRPDK